MARSGWRLLLLSIRWACSRQSLCRFVETERQGDGEKINLAWRGECAWVWPRSDEAPASAISITNVQKLPLLTCPPPGPMPCHQPKRSAGGGSARCHLQRIAQRLRGAASPTRAPCPEVKPSTPSPKRHNVSWSCRARVLVPCQSLSPPRSSGWNLKSGICDSRSQRDSVINIRRAGAGIKNEFFIIMTLSLLDSPCPISSTPGFGFAPSLLTENSGSIPHQS